MIKYIIVDDETIAHDIIEGYCETLSNFTLMKRCYDAIEATEFLLQNEVNLIFLDLNMPKLKGFEFLRTLQNPPNVIVTTAYQEHALEGYELNIVDYLLKPFSFERFMKAINKVKIKPQLSSRVATRKEKRLFLKSNKTYIQVKMESILFIEAKGNYVKVMTEDDEIQVRDKISEILKLLPEDEFLQVHKSFVIAKEHVNAIEGNRLFIKGFVIPIGKTFRKNIDGFRS